MAERLYPCYLCKRRLPAEEFPKCASRSTGLHSCCRVCRGVERKRYYENWRKRNPRKYNGYEHPYPGDIDNLNADLKKRAKRLWSNYRFTLEGYEALLKKQKNRCAICGGKPNGSGSKNGYFHIDHDSTTGKVRGLLCGNCNQGIGKFFHRSKRLRKAAQYLDSC